MDGNLRADEMRGDVASALNSATKARKLLVLRAVARPDQIMSGDTGGCFSGT